MSEKRPAGPVDRILVINVARIGDTILAVPVLRALRAAWPAAEIVCLAHPKRVEVLQGLTCIDRCGPVSKRSAPFMGWLGRRYDLVLVLGRERALLRYALRASRQVVALPSGDPALDRRLFAAIRDQGVLHAIHDRLRWLAAIGVPPASLRLDYRVSAGERAAARAWIAAHCGDHRPRVGFQIASFPTKAYRNWPAENFRELGRRILDRHPGAQILVFGDTADAEAGRHLADALGPRCHCVAGQFPLRGTLALMESLDLYVGVDTGPTHLAGALGIPMVAMYHCLHPGRYLAPLEHPNYLGVVEHPVDLANASTACTMDEISVDAVWVHVERALEGK
jgi:heptosyltransferase-3